MRLLKRSCPAVSQSCNLTWGSERESWGGWDYSDSQESLETVGSLHTHTHTHHTEYTQHKIHTQASFIWAESSWWDLRGGSAVWKILQHKQIWRQVWLFSYTYHKLERWHALHQYCWVMLQCMHYCSDEPFYSDKTFNIFVMTLYSCMWASYRSIFQVHGFRQEVNSNCGLV